MRSSRWGCVLLSLLMSALVGCSATLQSLSTLGKSLTEQRTQDADAFCRFVDEQYAYFDGKKTDWSRVCANVRTHAAAATDRTAWITLLEGALGEIYDAHAHLNTSTRDSPRLVPTNTDVFAVWHGDQAVIAEVRADSAAFKAGVRAGMRVLEVDDAPLLAAVAAREPRFLKETDAAARDWALQSVLAGRQNRAPVRLKLAHLGNTQTLSFNPDRPESAALLTHRRTGKNNDLGVIRINNALGETALIAAFDEALTALWDTKALLLDLRDTPSGGNTLVARGLMGRLVTAKSDYQRHEAVGEFRATGVRRVWTESVSPRGEAWRKSVVVLVGRWTGSMGEGVAIGLNAAINAPVIGSPMARLVGAIEAFRLPNSGIVVRVPSEKLFTTRGVPREAFVPCAPLPSPALSGVFAEDELMNSAMSAVASESNEAARGAPGTLTRMHFACS